MAKSEPKRGRNKRLAKSLACSPEVKVGERKTAEQAQRQSEERYQSLFSKNTEGYALHEIICDEKGRPSDYRFIEVNPYFEKLTGLSRNDVIGKTVKEAIPGIEQFWIDTYGEVALTGKPKHFEHYSKALARHFEIFAYCPKPNKFAVIFIDVTERKAAEDMICQSQEDYNRAQEVGNIGSWRLDVRKNILTWSDQNHRIFGIPKGTPMTYETFLSTVHPDDRKYVDTKWKAGLAGEPYDIEHQIVVDGQIKWVREKAFLEFDDKGILLGGFGITQDITDRKRLQAEIENLAKFPAENPFPVLRLARDGTILFSNKPGLAVLEQWDKQVGDKAPDEWCRWTANSLKSNRYVVKEIMFEHKIFSIAITPVSKSGYVNLYGRDITRQREYERQLRKSRDELEQRVKERTAQLAESITALQEEVQQRIQAQNHLLITNTLLELFVKKTSRNEYLDSVVEQIRDWSGCRCVGIRLINSDRYIPFEAWTGFNDQFLKEENMLFLETDNCLCVRAITQKKESQDIPLATMRGSFCTNNALEFIKKLSLKDKPLYRGTCVKHGFRSLAVVPIRYRDDILGAIHIADERTNMVPLEKVELLENMAMLIGEAVHRFDVEHSLRLSESRLSQAQRIARLGNWGWDITTGALWWSDEVYRIFGLEPQQFGATYEAFLSSVHPDDRTFVQESVNRALYDKESYDIDHKVIRPDGSECIVHEHAEVIYDENHKPLRMVGTVLDVTKQKEAEKQIIKNQKELRVLAAQLQLTEERERRRIAQDLHDSIGQILAFSTMALKALEKTAPQEITESLKEVSKQLDAAIHQARSLSFDLSPSVLYDIGLETAIEDLVERFSADRKILCSFKNCSLDKPLADDVKVLLYRCVRELLINAAKHAEADSVKVSCSRLDSDICITVEDDGRGFDVAAPDNRLEKTKGFGMLSIRERLNHIGGQFKIESAAGKGTKATLTAPLELG